MTETALATVPQQRALAGDDIAHRLEDPKFQQLIKDTYARGADDNEFALAMQTAKHLKLDPVSRQIFFVKRWDSKLKRETMATQVSIDGLRLIAERTGFYAGQTTPMFCGEDGVWTDVWLKDEPPKAAKVGVLRKDFAEPLFAVARYGAYVQTTRDGNPNSMWRKMPDIMLAKCAEALALRKAFPAEMSGAYTDDEMGQADNVEHRPPVPAKPARQLASKPASDDGEAWASFEKRMGEAKTMDDLKGMAPMAANLPESLKGRARMLWKKRSAEIEAAEEGHDPVTGEVIEEPPPHGDNDQSGFDFDGQQG